MGARPALKCSLVSEGAVSLEGGSPAPREQIRPRQTEGRSQRRNALTAADEVNGNTLLCVKETSRLSDDLWRTTEVECRIWRPNVYFVVCRGSSSRRDGSFFLSCLSVPSVVFGGVPRFIFIFILVTAFLFFASSRRD